MIPKNSAIAVEACPSRYALAFGAGNAALPFK